jgi:hypothetical protein
VSGIDDAPHRWFQSYLLGRSQYVRRGPNKSSSTRPTGSVRQGSVLGPVLFILNIAELISLIEQHGLSPHLYADDTQIYDSRRPATIDAFSKKVSECIGDIASWMRLNRLQLNSDETEVLWCSTGRRLHNYRLPH